MPAKLDVDKESVRVLVIAVGVREAARQMGLNEKTVLHWSHTGDWLAHTRPAPRPELPLSMKPTSVASVSAAEALVNTLESMGKETRLNLAKAVQSGAVHVSELKGHEVLKAARNVKELAGTASILHGWTGEQPIVRINVMQRLDEKVVDGPVIDI